MELIKTIGVAALALTITLTPLSTVHAQVSVPKDPELRAQLIALLTQQIQLLQVQLAELRSKEGVRAIERLRSDKPLIKSSKKPAKNAFPTRVQSSPLMTNTGGDAGDKKSVFPKVEVVSSSIDNNDTIELKVRVRAPESQDYYVPTSAPEAARYELTPEFSGTKRVAFTSSAKKKGDAYVIQEGETETFELHVQLVGSGTYAISFEGLRLMTESDGSKKVYEPEGGTYTTETVSL